MEKEEEQEYAFYQVSKINHKNEIRWDRDSCEHRKTWSEMTYQERDREREND